jgi:hypothetical protein
VPARTRSRREYFGRRVDQLGNTVSLADGVPGVDDGATVREHGAGDLDLSQALPDAEYLGGVGFGGGAVAQPSHAARAPASAPPQCALSPRTANLGSATWRRDLSDLGSHSTNSTLPFEPLERVADPEVARVEVDILRAEPRRLRLSGARGRARSGDLPGERPGFRSA